MRLVILALAATLAACAGTGGTPASRTFIASQPYYIRVSAPTPQLETLVVERVAAEFGRNLQISAEPSSPGQIDVNYTNQGRTMLITVRTKEHLKGHLSNSYKGELDASKFAAMSPEDAARSLVHVLSEQFNSEFRR